MNNKIEIKIYARKVLHEIISQSNLDETDEIMHINVILKYINIYYLMYIT